MRIVGIDYGTRRTGIAIADTDSDSPLALPFELFENLPDPALANAVAQLVSREAAAAIIIGVPLNADGSPSQQSKITERFILTLQQTIGPQFPLHRASEYLTTHDAESKLAGHFTRQQKRARVDALAAARILQDWLNNNPPAR